MTPLNGAFLIDKVAGITSSDVVIKLKIALTHNGYCEKGFKIGHGGTLDPFATGVLVILVGEATKLADPYLHSVKTYQGTITLGEKTDSADLTGTVIESAPVPELNPVLWQKYANEFTADEYLQTPPMHSAKKKDGVALYELARQGKTVDRVAILKKIYKFDITSVKKKELTFIVECESGTYIRVLAEDLAKKAGTVAHLKTLERVQTSGARLENTLTVAETISKLVEKTPVNEISNFLPLDRTASHVHSFEIDLTTAQKMKQGVQESVHQVCMKARVEYPKSRYVVVRTQDNPIALLEKAPESEVFRLQRILNS